MILRCFLCLIGLEIFVLSTFAKNDPLIRKTLGGFVVWGGDGLFLIKGKGSYIYIYIYKQAPQRHISARQDVVPKEANPEPNYPTLRRKFLPMAPKPICASSCYSFLMNSTIPFSVTPSSGCLRPALKNALVLSHKSIREPHRTRPGTPAKATQPGAGAKPRGGRSAGRRATLAHFGKAGYGCRIHIQNILYNY